MYCFFYFNVKVCGLAESHQIISDTYGKKAIIDRISKQKWFQRFKSGDFAVEDRHIGGGEKVFEDAGLEAILNEDSSLTQEELSESLGGYQ
nr:Mariner Mos1 transposase [Hymenolepis microstoma]CUU97388.1 Mariner Mos1 transposase [Hymenolepis microstoma]